MLDAYDLKVAMDIRFTGFEVKMAILELLAQKSPQNKFNMIGRPPTRGNLQYQLQIEFSDSERAFAGRAIEELKQVGLIAPTYRDHGDPENWLEITDAGRLALKRRAIDTLDIALRDIDPALCELRHGASSAIASGQPDSTRQAAHSARELIRQVLDILAPIEEIRAQPNFTPSKESASGVTRKMRVRYAIKRKYGRVSESEVDIIESLCNLIDSLYTKLSSEAHRDIRDQNQDIIDLLNSSEIALRRLLVHNQ